MIRLWCAVGALFVFCVVLAFKVRRLTQENEDDANEIEELKTRTDAIENDIL